jgi:hypothetical protein
MRTNDQGWCCLYSYDGEQSKLNSSQALRCQMLALHAHEQGNLCEFKSRRGCSRTREDIVRVCVPTREENALPIDDRKLVLFLYGGDETTKGSGARMVSAIRR